MESNSSLDNDQKPATKLNQSVVYCSSCCSYIHTNCCIESYLKQYYSIKGHVDVKFIYRDTEQTNESNESLRVIICKPCMVENYETCLKHLRKCDVHSYFTLNVTRDIAPTYFDVIKKPMSLSMMADKLESKREWYALITEFIYDFELICCNAFRFNVPHTKLWNLAWKFYEDGHRIIKEHIFFAEY